MKIYRKMVAILLLMVMLFSMLATGVYADYKTGTYKISVDNGVNLRTGAGTSYSKVGAIPYNKTVTVTEVKDGWGKTTYSGKTGWFSLEYAKLVEASAESTGSSGNTGAEESSGTTTDATKTYITTAALNLRKGPATSYDRYTVIPDGAKISISETKNGWGKTAYGGYTGWISMDYVKEYTTGSYGSGIYSIGYATMLYEEPSTSSAELIKIPLDTEVQVTEVSGGWGKTTYKGKTGWFNLANAGTVVEDGSILTGDQRTDIMKIAQAELGNTYGPKYTFGRGNVAWCAYFVSWCARQAGIPTSVIRNAGYARPWSHGVEYFLRESYLPSPGDLVYFDWDEYKGVSNHVGIVKEVKADGTIITIEGNSSDTVKNNTYRINGSGQYTRVDSIYYYGVPDYANNTRPITDLKLTDAKDGKVTLSWTATNGSYYDVYVIPSNVEDFDSGVMDLNESVARTREEGSSAEISLDDGSYVAVAYARPGSVAPEAESNRITFTLKNGTVEGLTPETPETSEPETPETSEPETPETSEPETPETSEPETPETSEPETPETSEPETPETSEPETPDLTGDYKTTAALNLRKAAGTSNARLLTIPKGKTIKITEVKDGWGKTTYSGKTGWVSMDYTKKVEASTGSTGSSGSTGSTGTTTTYTYKITTTSGVNLRSGAGTGYSKVGTIAYNKSVTVTEVKDGWGKTTYGGKTGWFSLAYAKKTGTTTTETGSADSGETTTAASVKYKITASNGVNLRSGAGTSYGKIGAIAYNKTVTVTEVKNGWGKTTYGSKTGWFSLDYAKKA